MSNPRPFQKHTETSIIFDNGNICEFVEGQCRGRNNEPMTVQEFMDYLLSDQYKIDNGYDL